METEIYACVEKATRRLVAIEMETPGYTRKDDPYVKRNIAAYLNENYPSPGTILSEANIAEWQPFEINSNDRDTLYKLEGPKISSSRDIFGFSEP
ncbi:MAG: hypothetical protein AAFX40_06730 [Cyanobacteria bacterium J06639_1]